MCNIKHTSGGKPNNNSDARKNTNVENRSQATGRKYYMNQIKIMDRMLLIIRDAVYNLSLDSNSIYHNAINCCKNKSVPKLCHGFCVPGGSPFGRKKGFKCGRKYSKEMQFCKTRK